MWSRFYVIWLGANEEKAGGSMSLLLLASSAARSANTLTFRSSAKPQPKESISMLRTPKRSAEKLSDRAKFTIDWLLPIGERKGGGGGQRTCEVLGGLNWKKKKYILTAKWFHTVHICTDRRVISGKNNTLQPNLSPHFHLLWVCLWSWSDAVNKWATL